MSKDESPIRVSKNMRCHPRPSQSSSKWPWIHNSEYHYTFIVSLLSSTSHKSVGFPVLAWTCSGYGSYLIIYITCPQLGPSLEDHWELLAPYPPRPFIFQLGLCLRNLESTFLKAPSYFWTLFSQLWAPRK